MSDPTLAARVAWRLDGPFDADAFSRAFDVSMGPVRVPASSAPAYHGDGERVNPEQLLAASLASCHMLTFLVIAARKRWRVSAYEDDAYAVLGRTETGHVGVTELVLRPRVTFDGPSPDAEALAKAHSVAHRNCFIAAAIRATVTILPADPIDAARP